MSDDKLHAGRQASENISNCICTLQDTFEAFLVAESKQGKTHVQQTEQEPSFQSSKDEENEENEEALSSLCFLSLFSTLALPQHSNMSIVAALSVAL